MYQKKIVRYTQSSSTDNNYNYIHPETRIRNITCVFCQKYFMLRDVYRIKGPNLPLLRCCGHPVCDTCAKSRCNEPCPFCKDSTNLEESHADPQLPLNIYIMGLLSLSKSRPIQSDSEPMMSFEKTIQAKIRDSAILEKCAECGRKGEVKCLPCTYNYCKKCFGELHKYKTNRGHKKISLENGGTSLIDLPIFCTDHKDNKWKHWCEDCDVPCCPDCVIDFHRKHSTIKLIDMNIQQLEDFQEAYQSLGTTLHNSKLSRTKVNETLKFPDEFAHIADIEIEINQHFLHLHGVLQNIEGKMIDTVRAQKNYRERKLIEIREELHGFEKQVEDGILMATSVEDHFDTVNLRDVIQRLVALANIPCYFIQEPLVHKERILFHADRSGTVASLEKHCKLEVQPVPIQFQLVSINDLADDIRNSNELCPKPQMPALFKDADFLKKLTGQSSGSSMSIASLCNSISSLNTDVDTSETFFPTTPSLVNPIEEKKQYYEVHVTSIDSPDSFYIRYASDNTKWTMVQRKMEDYNIIEAAMPDEIKIRELYAVKHENGKWFRALILGIVPDHDRAIVTYDIELIDTGEHEQGVLPSRIRELEKTLTELPPLAENHSLYDVFPRNGSHWDFDACRKMEKIIERADDKPLIMKKISPTDNGVDLIAPTTKRLITQSIRDSLVFLELASYTSCERLYKINPKSVAMLSYDEFDLDDFYDAVPTSIENPDCIYVRKKAYNEDSFKRMIDELNRDYQKTKQTRGKIYAPEVGLLCAAFANNAWHRGVVTEVLASKMVKVFLVDWGMTYELKYKAIRQLDTRYMRETTRAIKISMKDVVPVDNGVWSPDAKSLLEEWIASGVRLIAFEKINDCYSVCLRTMNNDNLNARIVRMGIAKSTGSASKQLSPNKRLDYSRSGSNKLRVKRTKFKSKRLKDKVVVENETEALTPVAESNGVKSKEILEEDPWKVHVNISKVVSPDEIYMSLASREADYREMDKKLQRYYNQYKAAKDLVWEIGNLCVVYCKNFRSYRRAKIVSITSPEDAVVELLDAGERMTFRIEDLQTLFGAFDDISSYVFQAKLGGIYPPGGSENWPSSSSNKLREIIEANSRCRFFIAKVADNENGPIIVDLFVEQIFIEGPLQPSSVVIKTINGLLMDEGLALPIRNFNDTKAKVLAADVKQELSIIEKVPSNGPGQFEQKNVSGCEGSSEDSGTIRDVESEESDAPEHDPIIHVEPLPEGSPSWPPPEPIADDDFIGEATFLNWEGEVYFVPSKNAAMKARLDEELTEFYEHDDNVVPFNEWKLGDLCITRWRSDKTTWHRAQIVGIKGSHLIIYYPDYGTTEWADRKALRKTLMFEDVPSLAIKCKIHRMSPKNHSKKWLRQQLDQLHFFFIPKTWKVHILRREPEHYVVSVMKTKAPYINIFQILTTEHCIDVFDPSMSSDSSESGDTIDVIVETTIESESEEEEIEATEINEELPPEIICTEEFMDNQEEDGSANGDKEISIGDIDLESQFTSESPDDPSSLNDLTVSESLADDSDVYYPEIELPDDVIAFHGALGEVSQKSANIVWIHVTRTAGVEYLSHLSEEYRRIMKEINDEAERQPLLETLAVGTPCCAIYETDQTWYRCKIKSVRNNGSGALIQVSFVDWGNSEWINPHELRVSKPEWLKVPRMSIKCHLHNIRICDNDPGVRDFLKKLGASRTKPLTVIIGERKGGEFHVQLFVDQDCENLLYQALLDEGQFKRDTKKILEGDNFI